MIPPSELNFIIAHCVWFNLGVVKISHLTHWRCLYTELLSDGSSPATQLYWLSYWELKIFSSATQYASIDAISMNFLAEAFTNGLLLYLLATPKKERNSYFQPQI